MCNLHFLDCPVEGKDVKATEGSSKTMFASKDPDRQCLNKIVCAIEASKRAVLRKAQLYGI